MSHEPQIGATPTLADLLSDPCRSLRISREAAAAMLAQVGALAELLRARLLMESCRGFEEAAVAGRKQQTLTEPNRLRRLLTLGEMQERSRKTRRWFYTHWRKTFPTAVKKGRTILVPEADFERWLHRP